MKYQNKRNGKVAVEVELNERTKVYTVVFEDGTSTACTTSTFKRWYKKLEDEEVPALVDLDNPVTEEEAVAHEMIKGDEAVENAVVDPDSAYVSEIMAQKKALGIECPPINKVEIVDEHRLIPIPGIERLAELKKEYAGDGTPLAEVGKEIAEQAKQKAKAVKKAPANTVIQENRDFVRKVLAELGYTVLEYEKLPGLFVGKMGKKTVCEVKAGRAISINFREADVTDLTANYHKVSNYYLPCVYKLTDSTDIKVILNDLKNNYITLTREEK